MLISKKVGNLYIRLGNTDVGGEVAMAIEMVKKPVKRSTQEMNKRPQTTSVTLTSSIKGEGKTQRSKAELISFEFRDDADDILKFIGDVN